MKNASAGDDRVWQIQDYPPGFTLADETGRNAPAPEAANLDKETVERLAALGYIGTPGAATSPAGPASALADPKDKLEVFTAVARAGELMVTDDYARAAEVL